MILIVFVSKQFHSLNRKILFRNHLKNHDQPKKFVKNFLNRSACKSFLNQLQVIESKKYFYSRQLTHNKTVENTSYDSST